VGVIGKSGSEAAALQIASSQNYAGLSKIERSARQVKRLASGLRMMLCRVPWLVSCN